MDSARSVKKNCSIDVSRRKDLAFLPFLAAFALIFLNAESKASVASHPSSICDLSAELAAREHSVPIDVLQAITRTETGRTKNGELLPWPWTVNMEGAGQWFETRGAAQKFAIQRFNAGALSFDIGCFQINYRWHGRNFSSISEMFDPVLNADYAARFLKSLFHETGDWSKAAAAYHSRTPEFAERYQARFDRIRSTMETEPSSIDFEIGRPKPLVMVGEKSLGSLVPILVDRERENSLAFFNMGRENQ